MRYAPASPEMHVALAATLASTGRLSDAEFEFGEALRLRPDSQEAKNGLESVRRLKKQNGR